MRPAAVRTIENEPGGWPILPRHRGAGNDTAAETLPPTAGAVVAQAHDGKPPLAGRDPGPGYRANLTITHIHEDSYCWSCSHSFTHSENW